MLACRFRVIPVSVFLHKNKSGNHSEHRACSLSMSWLTLLNCGLDSKSKIRYTHGYTMCITHYTGFGWKLKINRDNAKIMEVPTEQDKDQPRLSDWLNQTLIDERLDMAIDSSISQRPCVTLLNIGTWQDSPKTNLSTRICITIPCFAILQTYEAVWRFTEVILTKSLLTIIPTLPIGLLSVRLKVTASPI